MELRHLRALVAVAEHLNFSRAAAALYMSQPTLSNQINELEQGLGIKLFWRDSRSVILTAEGCILLERAREILKAIDGLERAANCGTLQLAGKNKLKISVEKNAAIYDTTGITRRQLEFIDAYPQTIVDVLEIGFSACTQALLSDVVDACFMVFRDNRGLDPALAGKVVVRDRLCLVYAERYGDLTAEQLLQQLGWYYTADKEMENMNTLHVLERMGLRPRVARTGNQQASLTYAEMGKCYAAWPEMLLRSIAVTGLKFIPLEVEMGAGIEHKLVWKRANMNPALKEFVDWFEEVPAGQSL